MVLTVWFTITTLFTCGIAQNVLRPNQIVSPSFNNNALPPAMIQNENNAQYITAGHIQTLNDLGSSASQEWRPVDTLLQDMTEQRGTTNDQYYQRPRNEGLIRGNAQSRKGVRSVFPFSMFPKEVTTKDYYQKSFTFPPCENIMTNMSLLEKILPDAVFRKWFVKEACKRVLFKYVVPNVTKFMGFNYNDIKFK